MEACLACPAGKYGADSTGGSDAKSAECSGDCDLGHYGMNEGATTSKCDGVCPAGTYGEGGSTTPECSGLCLEGHWGKEGENTSACQGECPAGMYCVEGTGSVWRPDGPGKAVEEPGGWPCPAGSYAKNKGNTNEDKCQPCGPGKYQDQWGQSACRWCPGGRYAVSERSVMCMGCLENHYTVADALADLASSCITCSVGKFLPEASSGKCITKDRNFEVLRRVTMELSSDHSMPSRETDKGPASRWASIKLRFEVREAQTVLRVVFPAVFEDVAVKLVRME